MRSKKNILIIISIIVVVSFILIIVFKTNQDRKETDNNMQIIKKNYALLSNNVNKYNEIRNKYSEMSNVLIMDTYKEKHEDYITLITEYNDVIKEIDNYINNINLRCNTIYPDIEINNICSSYKKTYEKLINLYVNDINNYNDFITKYNEYKKEELPLIEMIHKDYIDYDNDKIYEGSVHNDKN